METFECPGHEDKCKFCGQEGGNPRSVNGMPEISRLTGKRLVDPCCKACAGNLANSRKFYERTSIS